MTLEELNQKLAREKLIETGVGLVSPKTYEAIKKLCLPLEGYPDDSGCAVMSISFRGIKLVENPFIPDGEIYPVAKQNGVEKEFKQLYFASERAKAVERWKIWGGKK